MLGGIDTDGIDYLKKMDLMLIGDVPLFICDKEAYAETHLIDKTVRWHKLEEDLKKRLVPLSNFVTVNEKVFKDTPRRVMCAVMTDSFHLSVASFKPDEGVVVANSDICYLIYLV